MSPSALFRPFSADAIVGLCDHALLHPNLTDADLQAQLQALRPYPVASVCIKPYAVAMAVEALAGTAIGVGTVIGFPHGSPKSAVKAAEAEAAFGDGAREVDMVINVGKALSGDWAFVREDIAAVLAVARGHGGLIKVIFETDFLPGDAVKIRLCEICSDLGADYVKTSTGFGYVKQPNGQFATTGATGHDVELMRRHCPSSVGVKPSGGVRTLDDVLRYVELGATRIGTTATLAIHREALERFGR
jgi:deoxyribose-phosphate aldolase